MSDRAIQILILDSDVVFLQELTEVLTAEDDIEVIAQVQTIEQARNQLRQITLSELDLVVLEINLTEDESNTQSIQFCQELKEANPNLPLFLLTRVTEAQTLQFLRNRGIEGYAEKQISREELINALRQVARGEIYWQQGVIVESSSDPSEESRDRSLPQLPPSSQGITPPRWLTRQRNSGLAEIERNLAQVEEKLSREDLSNFDWLFWSGLRRELRAAQWVVRQLLPVEVVVVKEDNTTETNPSPSDEGTSALTSLPTSLCETLLQTTLGKIQLGLVNNTGYPLEIDILSLEKQRELLYLVIQEFQEILNQLRFVQLSGRELPERRSLLLRELWQTCLTRWISKYVSLSQFPATSGSILDFVMKEAPVIESMRLNRLPQITPLLAYLLYEEPLEIDNVSYRPESPEAQARAEMLLHNLILEVANGVMEVILNQFGEQKTIKTSLYQKNYRSSREIARFRNELSWQYRQSYYIREPKAIFESRYELLVLRGNRIQLTSIYAARKEELEKLKGIRLGVTIALELRDAIAPRFRAIFGVVGQGVVYVLTQVIGRGLGLIGRGILQGVGKSVEDRRDRS